MKNKIGALLVLGGIALLGLYWFKKNKPNVGSSQEKGLQNLSNFYKTGGDKNPWVEVEDGKIILQGTWSCSTNSNFKIDSYDGKSYTGGDSDWKDDSTPVEDDPETDTNFDRTKFPLKKGSEGKEVIQLQNYLNKEIPANPLVIDGIFGDLTHNKLVQVQKNKGVL